MLADKLYWGSQLSTQAAGLIYCGITFGYEAITGPFIDYAQDTISSYFYHTESGTPQNDIPFYSEQFSFQTSEFNIAFGIEYQIDSGTNDEYSGVGSLLSNRNDYNHSEIEDISVKTSD